MGRYKELDRPYVARQLDGPVITAVVKAIYNFLHEEIDEHTDYFRHLSIDTANTEHLFFIGKLMGLQLFSLFSDTGAGRYITFADDDYDADEYGYNNGWSNDYHAYEHGDGAFGTGEERDYPITLTDDQYRELLRAVADVPSASGNSIFMIDSLAHAFLGSSDYAINYNSANDNPNSAYVDIIDVVLGESVPLRMTSVVQTMYNKVLKGGATVLVTHI